jgi:cytochrome P450
MEMLNIQFKSGFDKYAFLPRNLRKLMPTTEIDKSFFDMKAMMRKFIKEHMQDVDYEHPRDFIDVYLSQIKDQDANGNFDIEQLVVICLDFFQAGAETTRYILKLLARYECKMK